MDDLLKELKERLKEPLDQASINRIKEEQRKREENNAYVLTDKYWMWIDEVLKRAESIFNHPSFGTSCQTDEDFENFDKLDNLYNLIEDYASRNYMYPIGEGYADFYNLKRGEDYYEVGIFSGQGSSFYVKRTAPVPECIDFECLKENVDTAKKEVIDECLSKIYDQVDVLIANKVPPVVIKNEIADYLRMPAEDKAKVRKIGSKK